MCRVLSFRVGPFKRIIEDTQRSGLGCSVYLKGGGDSVSRLIMRMTRVPILFYYQPTKSPKS